MGFLAQENPYISWYCWKHILENEHAFSPSKQPPAFRHGKLQYHWIWVDPTWWARCLHKHHQWPTHHYKIPFFALLPSSCLLLEVHDQCFLVRLPERYPHFHYVWVDLTQSAHFSHIQKKGHHIQQLVAMRILHLFCWQVSATIYSWDFNAIPEISMLFCVSIVKDVWEPVSTSITEPGQMPITGSGQTFITYSGQTSITELEWA